MKPTERFKQRYVAFELGMNGVHPLYREAKDLVHSHFIMFFGEIGVSALAFKFVKYDEKSGRGIIRCSRKFVDEAIFCMSCLTEKNAAPARLEPISTSGTIKRL